MNDKQFYSRNIMRIIWITHDLFEVFLPYVKGRPTLGGSWIAPLFYLLNNEPEIKLGSITPVLNGKAQRKEIDHIIYYSVPVIKNENTLDMNIRLAKEYLRAINDFKPDVIHVHGTEKNFGLLRKFIDESIPIVCSIQGIVSPCYDNLKHSVATVNIKKYRSIKNRLGRGGVNFALRKWKRYIRIEREIYNINNYFVGRTKWDNAQLMSLNPEAFYFHGEELLRAEFYKAKWEIDSCERHRIFVSSAASPLKGFHVLLKAAAILIRDYPDLKIVAPLSKIHMKSSKWRDFLMSEDYANYLKAQIKKLGLEDHVIFKKMLSAAEMANEYCNANIFVLPSYIENSPNSLGESMMIGVPSVACAVGGVSSIVKDDESSLLFSPGDYAYLAFQIKRIFSDDELAKKIGREARMIAQKRHHLEQTPKQYISIYSSIINQHHENIACSL